MLGKTYGFFVSFSGEGHEKFLDPAPGAPGETGEGSKAAVFGKALSTISISSARAEFWIWIRSLRPMTRSATPTTQTQKRYDPRMAPICTGRRDLSLEAFLERGGPSSGEGAGSQSMLRGLFLGTSVRRFAELIAAERRSRTALALITVSLPVHIMLLCYREVETSAICIAVVTRGRNVLRHKFNMELIVSEQ